MSSPTEFSCENRSQPPTLTGEALWEAGWCRSQDNTEMSFQTKTRTAEELLLPKKWVTWTVLLPVGGRDEVRQGRWCRQGQRRRGGWEVGVISCDHPEIREKAVECPGLWLYPCYALGNKGGSHYESRGLLGDLSAEIIESPGVIKTLTERDWTVWREDTRTHARKWSLA